MRLKSYLVFIGVLFSFISIGQGFKGVGILGLNLSQIDGDSLYGFDRAGLSIGGKLYYDSGKKYQISLEMLYSQRGSAPKISQPNAEKALKLQFFEIPVTISIHDWYVEKGNFHRVFAETGLSYSYLFNIKAPLYNLDYFRIHELNYILGAGFRFNRRIGLEARYTASFGNIYENALIKENKLTSYFLTLRTTIHFN